MYLKMMVLMINVKDIIGYAFGRDEYEVNDDNNAHGDDRYQGLVRMPLSAACLTTSPPPAGSRCSIRTQPTFKRKTFREYVKRPSMYLETHQVTNSFCYFSVTNSFPSPPSSFPRVRQSDVLQRQGSWRWHKCHR